jgi:hypothetical protein
VETGIKLLTGALLVMMSSCASMVTKPVKLATELTLKPIKIVTDATIDIVEKPAKKAVQWVKPKNPFSN